MLNENRNIRSRIPSWSMLLMAGGMGLSLNAWGASSIDKSDLHLTLPSTSIAQDRTIEVEDVGVDVFRKVNALINNDVFFGDRFYSEQNIKDGLGVRRVEWRHRTQDSKFAFLSGFGCEENKDSFSFSLGQTRDAAGREVIQLDIGVYGESAGLTFDALQEIFGDDWKDDISNDTIRRWHHGEYKPATRPHGNSTIRYEIKTPVSKWGLTLRFDQNAILQSADFVGEKQ